MVKITYRVSISDEGKEGPIRFSVFMADESAAPPVIKPQGVVPDVALVFFFIHDAGCFEAKYRILGWQLRTHCRCQRPGAIICSLFFRAGSEVENAEKHERVPEHEDKYRKIQKGPVREQSVNGFLPCAV